MIERCRACEEEIAGQRASVKHRCKSKPPVRMKRVGWAHIDTMAMGGIYMTASEPMSEGLRRQGWPLFPIYAREEDL